MESLQLVFKWPLGPVKGRRQETGSGTLIMMMMEITSHSVYSAYPGFTIESCQQVHCMVIVLLFQRTTVITTNIHSVVN